MKKMIDTAQGAVFTEVFKGRKPEGRQERSESILPVEAKMLDNNMRAKNAMADQLYAMGFNARQVARILGIPASDENAIGLNSMDIQFIQGQIATKTTMEKTLHI